MQQRVSQFSPEHEVSSISGRARLALATLDRSGPHYRFRVEPVSKGLFRIVDSRTETVKGWRLSHMEACMLADQLELSTRCG